MMRHLDEEEAAFAARQQQWGAAIVAATPQSQSDLAASLETALAHWCGSSPLWVFGYGSLIWKPELDFEQRLSARVFGYHRALCLRSVRYRGTPSFPGLVAGLRRGGSCTGVALQLSANGLKQQFERLWQREMSLGAYEARWLPARRLDGGPQFQALAFVVRTQAPHFCPSLSRSELRRVLRQAHGVFGSSLAYLEATVTALASEGLPDRRLERLLSDVRGEGGHPKDALDTAEEPSSP